MKKSIIVSLSVILCLCMLLFTGCKPKTPDNDTTAAPDSTAALDAVATPQEEISSEVSTEPSTEKSTEPSTEKKTSSVNNGSQSSAINKKPEKVTEPKVDTSKKLNSYAWNGNGTYKCGKGDGYLVPGMYYIQKTASKCTVSITNGKKDADGKAIGIEDVDVPYNIFVTLKAGYTIKINGGRIIHSSTAVVPGANNSKGLYSEGSYRVGTDIPAGEYLVYSTSGSETALCVAYQNADPFSEDADMRGVEALNPMYFTIRVGDIIEIENGNIMLAPKGAVARPDSNGAYDDTCMYKVGKDINPGKYKFVPDSADAEYAFIVYKNSFYEDSDMVVKENLKAKGTIEITLANGQYVDFYGAKLVPVVEGEEDNKTDDPVTDAPSEEAPPPESESQEQQQ
ncbi:MAG: hypothetical protein IJF40_00245 [Clostridia bacterium]|nr:hypothetical protein [Clostridia bacterium]